jgi:CPA1 family monovalent cation:H+ antiporter
VPAEISVGQIVGLFPWLLLGATLLGSVAFRLQIPYASMLVLGGVVFASLHLVAVPQLNPDLLLFAFLPPLLFEAAFRLDQRELRLLARPMLVLAVPGTILTAVLVGGALLPLCTSPC